MSRFVRLTLDDGSERPIDISPAAISAITAEWQSGSSRIGATVHIHGTCFSVTESRAEILAQLAEPAPSVEVTKEAAQAALCEWHGVTDPTIWSSEACADMRAAIEAADRARGLRP